MTHKIGIYYEESMSGIQGIMSGHEMEALEREIMMRKKSEVEAAFLQRFGVPGTFKFSVVRSQNKTWGGHRYGGRVIFRIIPDDARTYALLRKVPGWINQFL